MAEDLKATKAGTGKTHRQATPEELKLHEAEKPKILKAIVQNHARTVHKVRNMQNRPLYVDRGA